MQLARVIPEEVATASELFEWRGAKKKAQGQAEGLAEGRAKEARYACVTLAKAFHPSPHAPPGPAAGAQDRPRRCAPDAGPGPQSLPALAPC